MKIEEHYIIKDVELPEALREKIAAAMQTELDRLVYELLTRGRAVGRVVPLYEERGIINVNGIA